MVELSDEDAKWLDGFLKSWMNDEISWVGLAEADLLCNRIEKIQQQLRK